jgi:hypothetical protein
MCSSTNVPGSNLFVKNSPVILTENKPVLSRDFGECPLHGVFGPWKWRSYRKTDRAPRTVHLNAILSLRGRLRFLELFSAPMVYGLTSMLVVFVGSDNWPNSMSGSEVRIGTLQLPQLHAVTRDSRGFLEVHGRLGCVIGTGRLCCVNGDSIDIIMLEDRVELGILVPFVIGKQRL